MPLKSRSGTFEATYLDVPSYGLRPAKLRLVVCFIGGSDGVDDVAPLGGRAFHSAEI